LRTLIFGYGNLDRQDDGVAWHVLKKLKSLLQETSPDEIDEFFDSFSDPSIVFQLQLTPELAEEISRFDRVCFVDAHTGAVPNDVNIEPVKASFQHSPLTHHLTANSLLSIIQTIYKKEPEAIMVSVRGYEFGFSQLLSEKTALLAENAAEMIYNWYIGSIPN
jgi:hydrogenase maturation protease